VVVFNTLFGLSTTYWMAIVTRGLLGLLCGILGPIKAYASEVCRKEHQALGISLVTSSRAIALVIGPAIGGFLAQPAKKYPNLFSEESIFGRFPYFLPCFVISVLAAGAPDGGDPGWARLPCFGFGNQLITRPLHSASVELHFPSLSHSSSYQNTLLWLTLRSE